MKICFKCGTKKPLTEFYKHDKMVDGHLNKCKDCTKNDVRIHYSKQIESPEFVEHERKRGRTKYRRLYTGTGKANPAGNKKWIEKYPEKKLAIRYSSSLKKPFQNAEKHHWSYNSEHFRDVIWFTKQEHMKSHRFLIYDQERKMYRRFDTLELLDTKERHEQFITWCIKNKED